VGISRKESCTKKNKNTSPDEKRSVRRGYAIPSRLQGKNKPQRTNQKRETRKAGKRDVRRKKWHLGT